MATKDPLDSQGWVIALEGLDGCGTSTQAELLNSRLQREGYKSLVTREPSDGPIGKLIRVALSTDAKEETPSFPAHLALLFSADRLEHLERKVRPAVSKGGIVVTDRSLLSSLVYQSLELPESWIQAINAHAPLPHLFVWIDTPVEVCLNRIHTRQDARERYEKLELQKQLRPKYEEIFNRDFPKMECIRVNGDQDVEAVHEELWSLLQKTKRFVQKGADLRSSRD